MSVIHPITSTPRICQGPDCPRAREASKACSRCKSIWYCSVECQKAHWSTHKPKCLAGRAQVQPVKEEKGTEDPLALRGGIQEKLKGTALEFMKPRQDGGGMCYPDTYAAYLASKGEPFPEAFLDGHTSEGAANLTLLS